MKRFSYSLLVLVLAGNLLLGTKVYLSSAQSAGEDDVWTNLELFTRVLERVRQEHVDGEDVTYQSLIYAALRGMLSSLGDPHSEFMEPISYERLREDTEGRAFGGVGIVIGLRDGVLTVIEPIVGTPGFRAGLLPGDEIVRIDDEPTAGFQLEDAVERLRGREGTTVTMEVRRSSGEETKVSLERARIQIHQVKDLKGEQEYPLDAGGLGYVKIQTFDENTARQLELALERLGEQGVKGLILDLRDNPGGLLDQAVKVCDQFLPAGELIVSTEGRDEGDSARFYSTGRSQALDLPLAILVNGQSASASEIVAGCLQDLGRAVVVGETTFGKGSVQKILPMPGDTALRLTTSKYYTPSHKVIHGVGIEPDVDVRMSEDEQQALAMRRMILRIPGAEANLDQILEQLPASRARVFGELIDTVEDRPLETARDLLLERIDGRSGAPSEAEVPAGAAP